MTRIKICGITNLEDARIACECGADMLGFNFYANSPRFVSIDTARSIIAGFSSDAMKVGVFVNEDVDRIADIAGALSLDAIQLHGHEGPAIANELKAMTGCIIMKAFRVSNEWDAREILRYPADEILLDSYSPTEYGGTGETFDWSIAKKLAGDVRLVLAGGLSATNVAAAIEEVRPYAVDACSRIESSPGKKDPEKLRAFIREARK